MSSVPGRRSGMARRVMVSAIDTNADGAQLSTPRGVSGGLPAGSGRLRVDLVAQAGSRAAEAPESADPTAGDPVGEVGAGDPRGACIVQFARESLTASSTLPSRTCAAAESTAEVSASLSRSRQYAFQLVLGV